MTRLFVLGSALALLVLVVPSSVVADVITIDGIDTDWGSIIPPASDGNEAGITDDAYDINRNWFHWGYNSSNERRYFMMVEQFDPSPTTFASGSYTELLVDARPGGGSRRGLDGVDYYAAVGLNAGGEYTRSEAYWYRWTGTTFSFGGGPGQRFPGVPYAWGDNPSTDSTHWVIEWELDPNGPTVHGDDPLGDIRWAAYLDGATTDGDDICPSDGFDDGTIPEPGTFALFGLGLVGMIAIRRRRRAG
jgi:hypothetical protein